MEFISKSRIDRESNMELLRIVAMAMVVLTHTALLSVGAQTAEDIVLHTSRSAAVLSVELLTESCVNLFILISGYFGIRASVKGAVALTAQAVFIMQLVFWVAIACGQAVYTTSAMNAHLDPGCYWFLVKYLMLYASAPAINAFIKTLSKSRFGAILIAFLAVELVFGWWRDYLSFERGYSLQSFIFIYMLGRYIKLYAPRWTQCGKWVYLAVFASVSALSVAAVMALPVYGGAIGERAMKLEYYNSPNVLLATVALFLFFNKLHFRSRTVNVIAVSTFAIYLFHGTPEIFFPYLVSPVKAAYATGDADAYLLVALRQTVLLCIAGVAVGYLWQLVWGAAMARWQRGCWLRRMYDGCCSRVMRKIG